MHFSRRSRIASDAATFSPGEVRQREKGGEVRGVEGRRQEKRGGEIVYTARQFVEP